MSVRQVRTGDTMEKHILVFPDVIFKHVVQTR